MRVVGGGKEEEQTAKRRRLAQSAHTTTGRGTGDLGLDLLLRHEGHVVRRHIRQPVAAASPGDRGEHRRAPPRPRLHVDARLRSSVAFELAAAAPRARSARSRRRALC